MVIEKLQKNLGKGVTYFFGQENGRRIEASNSETYNNNQMLFTQGAHITEGVVSSVRPNA